MAGILLCRRAVEFADKIGLDARTFSAGVECLLALHRDDLTIGSCQPTNVRLGPWSCKCAPGDGPEAMGRFGDRESLPHTPLATSSGLMPTMFMTRVRL